MDLIIGTAQFGMDYGISNKEGRISLAEVKAIVDYADANELYTYDTAPAYGVSEEVLGEFLNTKHKIMSKTLSVNDDSCTKEYLKEIEDTFYSSLEDLGIPSIDTILIHGDGNLSSSTIDYISEILIKFKNNGLVRNIGASLYTKNEVESFLENEFLDSIQLPINICDQRLIKGGLLEKVKAKNVTVFARSIFLQGLLLSKTKDLPQYFSSFEVPLKDIEDCLRKYNISKVELCMYYIKQLGLIDGIVVGVNSNIQFQEIVSAFRKIKNLELDCDFSQFAINDEMLIDPRKWIK